MLIDKSMVIRKSLIEIERSKIAPHVSLLLVVAKGKKRESLIMYNMIEGTKKHHMARYDWFMQNQRQCLLFGQSHGSIYGSDGSDWSINQSATLLPRPEKKKTPFILIWKKISKTFIFIKKHH